MHQNAPRGWWRTAARLAVLTTAAFASRAHAQPAAADRASAQAEFDAATQAMKDVVGELTVLQHRYHEEKAADRRQALEEAFEAAKLRGAAAGTRLEQAAIGLLAADPTSQQAREIAGSVAAGALRADDPGKALATVEAMSAAGGVDADVMAVAASAALTLSKLDDAAAWLAKAEAAGMPAKQAASMEAAIDRARPKVEAEMAARQAEAAADDLPRVKIATSAGDVVVELFENEAPNTVANFIALVEKGFYDGTVFHRVIGGFMAQGGDPTGSGSGGPGHAIRCECGQPSARKHFLGSLSMAHAGKDTGGSQFFLTFAPTEHLDGKHTVFGRVIEGFETLPKIARTQDEQGMAVPGVQPDRIVKASVVRKRDHAYEPETLPAPRR